MTHNAGATVLSLTAILSAIGLSAAGFGAQEDDVGSFPSQVLDELDWRCIGPPRGGRATACTGVEGDPLTYYMGGTGGGVWKTSNAGLTWQPVSDGYFGTGSVGAVAVAPSDPNVVYVGMGEVCIRGNFSHGDGMYKSVDAGKTWSHIGLEDTRQIGSLVVHPDDPDTVYVAALGHVFGPNEQRGVFRSSDGGDTWDNVLFVDDNTGAVDLAMDPNNARVLYAGFWQVKRTPWNLESGGEGSGLYRSTDGGDTWTELTDGLPSGVKGKIGVTISPVNSDRVWAIVEAENGGVFRSDNAGESWRQLNDDRVLRQRAWYYTHIYADSTNVDTVYVLNVSFHKSTDGGRTFTETIRVPHGDNHDLWINPQNNMNMISANDGGANVSFDGGRSWTRQDGQPTAQFYHVTVDNQYPYRVYGAQQDNSTISVSSQANQFRMFDYYSVGGGESGYIAVRPDDPNIVYAGSYGGYLTRYDHRARQSRNIMVWPENPMGAGVETMKHRFQWTFPIVISPHDSDTLYVGGNRLFKSTDEGQSWRAISPDLTTDDESKQGSSGGPITQDNTSVEYYCTIFAVAESPHEPGVIWTGSDDGLVHITRDGGESWTNITPAGLGEWSMISQIDASPHNPGVAYLAVNRYKMDDFKPYIFATDNYGQTWKLITHGIADDAFVRAVREDPKRQGLLYAGTETGAYVSFDDGELWHSLQMNLPATPITDLVVKDDDLVLATQGRSFWILSHLALLRQMSSETVAAGAHLYEPAVTYRVSRDAVDVFYSLAADDESITLEFANVDGELIRSFGKSDDLPTSAGLNHFRWNMRYADAVEVPSAVMWGGGTRGPSIAPGDYEVRLTAGDDTQVHSFVVAPDPTVDTTLEEYARQFDLHMKLYEALSDTHTAINQLREIRNQATTIADQAEKMGGADSLVDAAKALCAKLDAVEEELIQHRSKSNQDPLNFPIKLNDKLAGLGGIVGRSNHGPTDQMWDVYEDLMARLQPQLQAFREVMETDVPAFNTLVRERDVPALWVDEDSE